MAPRLSKFMHNLIVSKIDRGDTNEKIATDVSSPDRVVTPRAVSRIRRTYTRYGTPTVPPRRTGPDPKITPLMLDALYCQLAKDQSVTRQEMASFLYDKYGEEFSVTTITRALQSGQITCKTMRHVALQQLPELRHFYQYILQKCGVKAPHCVFIDESGINPPDALRRKGWAKAGVTPVLTAKFQRGTRVQILSALTLKGIKLSRVFTGSTDKEWFEDFIEQLLRHCGRWPEPESVLIMDNASFHFSDKIEDMCRERGVRLFMTAPYTPRTNPIEEHFGVLKTTTRSKDRENADLKKRSFEQYVKACINALSKRSDIAEGRFRNSGFYIEQQPDQTS